MSKYAKRTIKHYFKLAVPSLDYECGQEIEGAIDSIVAEAVKQADERFALQLAAVAKRFSEHIDRLDAEIERLKGEQS